MPWCSAPRNAAKPLAVSSRPLFTSTAQCWTTCFQFAFTGCLGYIDHVKAVALTTRGCPEPLHRALKQSADAIRRSLNGEILIWLERQAEWQPVSARETARILRELNQTLSADDRKRWVAGITEARKKMADEHLH